jgi:hypothetical protein
MNIRRNRVIRGEFFAGLKRCPHFLMMGLGVRRIVSWELPLRALLADDIQEVFDAFDVSSLHQPTTADTDGFPFDIGSLVEVFDAGNIPDADDAHHAA